MPTCCCAVCTEVLCLFPDLRPNQGALIFRLQTNTPKPRVCQRVKRIQPVQRKGPLQRYCLNEIKSWLSDNGNQQSKASHRFDIQNALETWLEYKYECRIAYCICMDEWYISCLEHRPKLTPCFEVYKMDLAKTTRVNKKHSRAKKLKPPAGGMELGQSRFTWIGESSLVLVHKNLSGSLVNVLSKSDETAEKAYLP